MDIWEDISKKVGDAASAVGRGAEKLTDIAKLKYAISVRQGKLEKIFESIGSLKYDEYKDGADNSEVVSELLRDADAVNAELADLRERLSERTGSPRCANCGAKLVKGCSFCPSCGKKQTPDAEPETKSESEE